MARKFWNVTNRVSLRKTAALGNTTNATGIRLSKCAALPYDYPSIKSGFVLHEPRQQSAKRRGGCLAGDAADKESAK